MAAILFDPSSLLVRLGPTNQLYVRRDRAVRSHGPVDVGVAVPRWSSALVARVVTGSWIMQRLSSREEGGRVEITCRGGRQLVGIKLEKDERLAVNLRNLVGHSGRPRFASYANLSIAAFAVDRNFTTIVTGPGMLILEANGNVLAHTSGQVTFDPEQLIAWDPRARFQLDRLGSLADVYLNRPRLRCHTDGGHIALLLSPDLGESRIATNPLWSFIKSVYIPRWW